MSVDDPEVLWKLTSHIIWLKFLIPPLYFIADINSNGHKVTEQQSGSDEQD
jgi:hypothetical protein